MARIELLDEMQLEAMNRENGLDHTVAPTLFFEFHSTPGQVAEQAGNRASSPPSMAATGFQWATDETRAAAVWDARQRAYAPPGRCAPARSG